MPTHYSSTVKSIVQVGFCFFYVKLENTSPKSVVEATRVLKASQVIKRGKMITLFKEVFAQSKI